MKTVIACTEPAFPILHTTADGYTIKCSDLSVPELLPLQLGLSELEWSDVSLLIGALLLSATLAIGYNLLTRLFYRG